MTTFRSNQSGFRYKFTATPHVAALIEAFFKDPNDPRRRKYGALSVVINKLLLDFFRANPDFYRSMESKIEKQMREVQAASSNPKIDSQEEPISND